MNQKEILKLLDSFKDKQTRTIVIVDFSNVEKWKESLKWKVDIKKLGQLVKHFSKGNKELRRFYYGEDYGPSEKSQVLTQWSKMILNKAKMNRFEVKSKRVKYIHDNNYFTGFKAKCDFDVVMAVDLVKLRDLYDDIILFSGDGDLMYVIEYLHQEYNKNCLVFGARNHIGREIFNAEQSRAINRLLFVESFDYRLKLD